MEEVKKYDEIIKKAGKFKFLGAQMVQTLPMGLAPASGIRARSDHHHEVRLGLGIIFMYNMSILEAFWGWGW